MASLLREWLPPCCRTNVELPLLPLLRRVALGAKSSKLPSCLLMARSKAELIRHFELYGVCIECRRMERIDIASLIANGESALRVEELRSRVRCRHCRRRTNDIRIVYAGPCGHARGFHYRD